MISCYYLSCFGAAFALCACIQYLNYGVYVAEFQLWGKSCSLCYPYVLHVLWCLFEILVISHCCFEGRLCQSEVIACLSLTSISIEVERNNCSAIAHLLLFGGVSIFSFES